METPESVASPAPPTQIVLASSAIAPANEASEELAERSTSPATGLGNRFVLLMGMGVGLTALVGSLYMLTRPCVLSKCVPLQQAEQLSQTAIQTAQTTTSAQAVVEAYDQLVEANHLLGTIPLWSKQHAIAQLRLQSYATQTASLEKIVSALRQAQTAAQRSQNPPHPFTEWQEIQTIWQQAIARLQTIPAGSPVYGLSERKQAEYQANLAMIGQRIVIERQAQEKVNAAQSTARIADARGGVATSAESWQLTHATWQAAVDLLRQVPQSTSAHAEAGQLLAIYQPKLAAVRDRATQERIAANAYSQAIRLAGLARTSEQQKQWSQAVEQWRDALTHAQQVSNQTAYYRQVQPLLDGYNAALLRSQQVLRITASMQSADADLSRTCSSTIKLCDYSFAEKAIRIRITPEYDRLVEQSIVGTPATSNNIVPGTVQGEATVHVNTLLRALAAIGKNANLPIELYSSSGALFGSYEPQFSGYVAR
jgi:hypothetical protein